MIEEIQRIRIPLSYPLRWVNSYLIKGDSGYTVIDPGLHSEEAKEAWQNAINDAGMTWRNITQIVLTHHHPDHFGLSGWLQEKSGAVVYITSDSWQQAQNLWYGERPLSSLLMEMFRRHGLGSHLLSPMEAHMDQFIKQVSPAPEVHILDFNQPFDMGNQSYDVIHTPGHAWGHVSLYQAETATVFCGDHVMPRITPNVSYIPQIDENPFAHYLESLEMMASIDIKMAYPGHWHPFDTYRKRIREIIRHHEKRLDQIIHHCRRGQMNDMELCRRQFGDKLSVHQLRFVLSETIAHTLYLEQRGLLKRMELKDRTIAWKVISD